MEEQTFSDLSVIHIHVSFVLSGSIAKSLASGRFGAVTSLRAMPAPLMAGKSARAQASLSGSSRLKYSLPDWCRLLSARHGELYQALSLFVQVIAMASHRAPTFERHRSTPARSLHSRGSHRSLQTSQAEPFNGKSVNDKAKPSSMATSRDILNVTCNLPVIIQPLM